MLRLYVHGQKVINTKKRSHFIRRWRLGDVDIFGRSYIVWSIIHSNLLEKFAWNFSDSKIMCIACC